MGSSWGAAGGIYKAQISASDARTRRASLTGHGEELPIGNTLALKLRTVFCAVTSTNRRVTPRWVLRPAESGPSRTTPAMAESLRATGLNTAVRRLLRCAVSVTTRSTTESHLAIAARGKPLATHQSSIGAIELTFLASNDEYILFFLLISMMPRTSPPP